MTGSLTVERNNAGRRRITCVRCGRRSWSRGRGLGACCWYALQRDGKLDDYPSTRRSLPDFVADYLTHRARGLKHRQIDAVMGYRPGTVSDLCTRARRAGLLATVVTR